MTEARLSLGRAAERLARHHLARAGWRLVEANARTRSGELDLVALDDRTLVFVEVKAARAGRGAGPPGAAAAVTPRKQRKVRLVAREWLAAGRAPSGVAGYRFDVIGVTFGPGGAVELDHIRAAF